MPIKKRNQMRMSILGRSARTAAAMQNKVSRSDAIEWKGRSSRPSRSSLSSLTSLCEYWSRYSSSSSSVQLTITTMQSNVFWYVAK